MMPDADLLYEFGRNIGIAFQLQDDFLDVYADPSTFGKEMGNDIVSNKKTLLLDSGSVKWQRALKERTVALA